MKEILQLRQKIKAKKPVFLKQDAHKIKKLKKNWRFPRGMHSKLRRRFRSYRKHPSPSYSSPKEVRGLTKEGHKMIIIKNPNELENIKTPFYISGNFGTKKKLEIIKKALSQKLTILNVKEPENYIKQAEESMKKRKDEAKMRKQKKDKKAKEGEKKKEEKKPKELTEEQLKEKKKKEEEEKRKVLEKKE